MQYGQATLGGKKMAIKKLMAAVVAVFGLSASMLQGGWTAYVSDDGNNVVYLVDVDSNTITGSIPAGQSSPRGMAITPVGTTAYVANAASNTVTVIDLVHGTVTGFPIPVDGTPQAVAITPNATTALVYNSATNTVSSINLAMQSVTSTIPIASGPQGIAISPDRNTAYVTSYDTGSVTTINLSSGATGSISVGSRPWGISLTPTGTTAYVCNTLSDSVTAIDLGTNGTGSIPVGHIPTLIAVTPDSKTAYIVELGSYPEYPTLSAIDTATNTKVHSIPLSTTGHSFGFSGIAITPDSKTAYITATDNTDVPVTGLIIPVDLVELKFQRLPENLSARFVIYLANIDSHSI